MKPSHATNYFANCALASSAHDGLSPSTAWNTLAAINAHTFLPGDVLAFSRGTSCSGSLQPKGSGTASAPIRVTAYGSGGRPVIQSTGEAAVKIYNQEYWEIDGIETSGGYRFGIWILADVPSRIFHHFRISNAYVHDVMGPARWDGGSVVVIPMGQGTTLDDVVIDSVTVANSNQWYGIHVGFNFSIGYGSAYPFSTRITIRDSQVSNVYGDGITTAQAQDVLIDHNVVHDVGLAPPGISYTPNAIWSWSSDRTTVQYNEGYRSHSYNPAQDGGIFDVDWGSSNTTIQYNYAHDADGYCVSAFGSQGTTTSNSIIRYNICSHNQQRSSQGEIFIDTSNGSLNGVQIYNNTISANAPAPGGVLHVHAAQLNGTLPNVFENNIIYSAGSLVMDTVGGFLNIHNNLYWYTGSGFPSWTYAGQTYTTLSTFQSGSRQGANDLYANPLLTNPLYTAIGRPVTSFQLSAGSPAIGAAAATSGGVATDFFGDPIPTNGPYTIGAYQWSVSLTANSCDLDKSGSANVLDVQVAVNQAIGLTACGSADINGDGACTVIDVQRVVNAALGLVCKTGP